MTSAGIGYFSLTDPDEENFVRWDILDGLPGEEIGHGLRHVRLESPLAVRMDGQTGVGVILL
jgi:hypothetical protein